MDKFLRIMSVWFKVSLYGILGILGLILTFMLADLLFDADFGYNSSDFLIVGGIAILTVALFAAVRGVVMFVKRQ